jgi:hypothetical protein
VDSRLESVTFASDARWSVTLVLRMNPTDTAVDACGMLLAGWHSNSRESSGRLGCLFSLHRGATTLLAGRPAGETHQTCDIRPLVSAVLADTVSGHGARGAPVAVASLRSLCGQP